MPDKKYWEVSGTFMRSGKRDEFCNVYEAKNEDGAKKVAMKDYNTYVNTHAKKYEKGQTYGKLTITKVVAYDISK